MVLATGRSFGCCRGRAGLQKAEVVGKLELGPVAISVEPVVASWEPVKAFEEQPAERKGAG